ncbi:MAG: alanine--tRNA ligase [Thermofilaceae archaeon]|nr:alanine--tRNA ligase [Thermofilaceae archaeon]
MHTDEFLRLPFFKEHGFILKKCRVCGKDFWTLDSEREVCGDQPCVDYSFIGERIGLRAEKPEEVREAFLGFFERESHTRIRRYPVVARWRDDVFLVGASIYNFQPWVTEGLVDPPANPLTISQPSIRLTDLDNVGKSGRHLTGFEMMAHHAFNIGGKEVYWANETIEYAYRVLTKVFRIPGEEITFKFDWWSGGGNAGEDYEVLVKGLEIATLVFMHYKVRDENTIIAMQNKIVDTGYGLERLVWLTNGSPTVYDAVFPTLIEKLRSNAGLETLDHEIAVTVARKSGKLDFKDPESSQRTLESIAKVLGMKLEQLLDQLSPYYSLYALADHSRTIMWMLGDGVVPSNVEAGYLARLLIRRALRHLWGLGIEENLYEIVAWQIETWKRDFPEYVELLDEILDMVDYEEKKYRETLRHGKRVIEKVAKTLKYKNISEMPLKDLVEIYESHGVPPEIVAEEASRLGISVKIPPDFFATIVSKHEAGAKRVEVLPDEFKSLVNGLHPTEKLYYKDPLLVSFEAKVLRVSGNILVLDQTAFYPEGGGQPHDEGVIMWEDGSCRVTQVINAGGVILHICDGKMPPEGAKIVGHVNAERRLALMRNHTATHIILGAARKVLGRHVWQTGAQKGVEQSRLDITHHKKITEDELRAIEELSNKVVMEDRPVRVFYEDRVSAEMKYGFTLYQGGAVPEARLRIVEIEGWDAEACGGIHCRRTGEVGLIKIVKVERIQDGVSRLVFKVGQAALEHIWKLESDVEQVARLLGVDYTRVAEAIRKLVEEQNALSKELRELRSKLLEVAVRELANKVKVISGIKVIADIVEEKNVNELALKVAERVNDAVVGLVNSEGNYAIKVGNVLLERGFDARFINAQLLKKLKGRGGGVVDLVSGKIENPSLFPQTLEDVISAKA